MKLLSAYMLDFLFVRKRAFDRLTFHEENIFLAKTATITDEKHAFSAAFAFSGREEDTRLCTSGILEFLVYIFASLCAYCQPGR